MEPTESLSRRALLGGGGLLRRVRERFDDELADAPPSTPRARPRDFWAAGDHARLARRTAEAAERLVGALDVRPGERVLDVAAGDGNVALAAARRGAEVVAIDCTPELLEHGRARAAEAGLIVDWRAGDMNALPVQSDGFDVVASAFGVIYGPDMRRATAELLRVLDTAGGRLGLATWGSAGAMGVVLRAARRLGAGPRPAGAPERWGNFDGLRLALDRFPGFELTTEALSWRYPDRDALWSDLSAPPGPLAGAADAARADMEERLAPFLRDTGEALELRVDWCLALAALDG